MTGVVYFIQEGEAGPIKIGWTSKCPYQRRDALQTGNSEELHLKGILPDDDKSIESLWHAFYSKYRKRSEWFWPAQELLDAIKHQFPAPERGGSRRPVRSYKSIAKSELVSARVVNTDRGLNEKIDFFMELTGMTPTRFGECALGDPNLVFQIREGRWLRGPTRKRVLDFIETAAVDHGPLQSVGT